MHLSTKDISLIDRLREMVNSLLIREFPLLHTKIKTRLFCVFIKIHILTRIASLTLIATL